ncbi:hypothetical protein [Sandaracinus amylolyticus]|uniref:hypothetical protein n=1 Tax=Sandaracinus amylolyticus TaxID=927083 RepID=UPI001F44EF34|nr:hypothetical protein [Sandaracinus amylolyticus]UJR86977.1 Hypothetical protein I5071_90780 [Sandaracinus amylolyticus]
MRRLTLPLSIALLIASACSGPERPPPERPREERMDAGTPVAEAPVEEPGLAVPEDDRAPEGPACMRSDSCGAGMQCRGAPGCTSDWACGEARECMDENVAYCDCDGATFYARGGCPGKPYAHVGPCEAMGELIAAGTELGIHDYDEPPTTQDRTCESSSQCGRGLTCFGIAGCSTDWTCVRARGCTRDRAAFCGCDGQTFHASSTCPGRPFVHRGACREAIARAEEPDAGAPIATRERDAGVAIASRERDAGAPIASRERDAGAATSVAMSIPEEPAPRRGERSCRTNRDCPGNQVCQGPAGCGMEWTCGRPERACVRDTQVFCDCEGQDFRASMFCPGRPYRHRGSCEIDRLLDLSGAAVR